MCKCLPLSTSSYTFFLPSFLLVVLVRIKWARERETRRKILLIKIKLNGCLFVLLMLGSVLLP